MRKQDKLILWPIYFDSTKTRLEGRRVPKSLATLSPKVEEIRRAAEGTGLSSEIVLDAAHPSAPWQKTGLLIVPKTKPKAKTIQEIAKKLLTIRG